MKRKQLFYDIPCNIINNIYEYDNTYKIVFNNVLKELVDNYNEKKDNKLKEFIVKMLKNEWYNNKNINYLFPKTNFNIIVKAMKDEIINNPIIFKHIKFIFRSLCHYNNSDGLKSYNDNFNMCPRIFDDTNEYNEYDTIKTIQIQTGNFLKDIINELKLEQFLYDFIDDNDWSLDSYLLSDKYNEIKQDVNEEYNTKNIFTNYKFERQPHLYNYLTSPFCKNDNENYINYNKQILKKAEKLYIVKNGLCNNTIQIRHYYNKGPNERLCYYELLN